MTLLARERHPRPFSAALEKYFKAPRWRNAVICGPGLIGSMRFPVPFSFSEAFVIARRHISLPSVEKAEMKAGESVRARTWVSSAALVRDMVRIPEFWVSRSCSSCADVSWRCPNRFTKKRSTPCALLPASLSRQNLCPPTALSNSVTGSLLLPSVHFAPLPVLFSGVNHITGTWKSIADLVLHQHPALLQAVLTNTASILNHLIYCHMDSGSKYGGKRLDLRA